MAASLLLTDVWPLVANMVGNRYIHNDAVMTTAEWIMWDPPVRLFRTSTHH